MTSSGIGPHASTAESIDDTVRRLVVERSFDLILLSDPLGTVVYASPSWAALGWTPGDLVGMSGLDLVHPDDLAAAIPGIAAIAAGKHVDAALLRLKRADGG